MVEIIEISSGIERVVKSLDAKSVAVIIDDLNKMKCYQYDRVIPTETAR